MRTLGSALRAWAPCTVLFASVAVLGCGGGDSGGGTTYPPAGSTYQGGYSDNGGGAGGVTLTIAAAAAALGESMLGGSQVTATGEMRPAGESAVALTGTYDTTTYTLLLTQTAKGANPYSLTGFLLGGTFRGTVTTALGTGGFAAVPVSTPVTETVFCGTYTCGSCQGGGGGYFDSIVFGTAIIVGVTSSEGVDTLALIGTVDASSVSIDDQGVVATGTIFGGSIDGTYSASGDDGIETGAWHGSTDACGVARR